MLTIIGLILIVVGALGLLSVIVLSQSISIIVIVVGVLLAVFGGGMAGWGRRPPTP
jgi:hypothetical protein